jgi:hypothetical protein
MFTNGDFETGDWTGWTVKGTANGQTAIQDVIMYDIDGAGPLKDSLAGRLNVGQINFNYGVFEGVLMTQGLNLAAGQQYGFGFDVSAWNNQSAGNADGGKFELLVGSQVLDTWNSGGIGMGEKLYGKVSGNFTPAAGGMYDVGLRVTRPWKSPAAVYQLIDNGMAVPEPASLMLLALAGLALRRR